jgi:hypothetical protein
MSKSLKLAVLVFALLVLIRNPAHAAWHTMYSYSAWPQSADGLTDFIGSTPTRYICRAYYEGGVHPGWTLPGNGYCAFGWGGLEQDSSTYDLWVDDWQPASNGNVPANAIAFGYEQAAVPQPGLCLQVPRYVCQAYDPENGLASGKVAPDIGGCDFPWGGCRAACNHV